MKELIFQTLIKERYNKNGEERIRGFISGIQYAVCRGSEENCYTPREIADVGLIITTKCTEEQYNYFINIVEKRFPKYCIFHYEERRSRYK